MPFDILEVLKPMMLGSDIILIYEISTTKRKIADDIGHPCLMPRSMLQVLEIHPLFFDIKIVHHIELNSTVENCPQS
jgi:hypothetical protein